MGGVHLSVLSIVGLFLAITYYIYTAPVRVLRDRSILSDNIAEEYDYVIVGGGSAGCVVAARLAEDKNNKVLLLEAGGFYDENDNLHIPFKIFTIQQTKHDWQYKTEPQEHGSLGMLDRKTAWPGGKVLGGSGMMNGMQYTRGSRHDYDEWERNGCNGWSFKDVLPYFLKSEDMQIENLKDSKYHNTGGPLTITSGAQNKPLADLFMKAGEELGYKIIDYNSAEDEGFSNVQSTIKNGVRGSTSVDFLGRRGKQDNLDIAVNCHVTKIDIPDNKATGVYFIKENKKRFVKARKEIIVSAGAVNTPQLLMLSGIGPKNHLKELGIPVKADLPVGENLQDHVQFSLLSKINQSLSILPFVTTSKLEEIKYRFFGAFPWSISSLDATAFLYLDRTKVKSTYPDIQMIFFDTLMYQNLEKPLNLKENVAKEYLMLDTNQTGFFTIVMLSHPKSTGDIKLKSSDPFDYPAINPRYLSDKRDITDLIGGIRLWEKYIDTPTMKKLGVEVSDMKLSFCGQHDFISDAYWECMVRHITLSTHHPCGTCKMGAVNDPSAVVDPQLRVKGINGLRVVDASIFPNVTSGNTNAPVIMAAEKLADMVRGKDTVKHLRAKIQGL